MRFAVRVLACLGAGAVSLALADPSTPAQQQPATAPSSSAPAATATNPGAHASPAPSAAPTSAAAAPAKPAVDPEEKRLIAMGYKPEMRNGEKVFCHRVEETGSRLGGKKECGTAKDLEAAQTANREEVEKQQRLKGMPTR
jgi:hypothetical protein